MGNVDKGLVGTLNDYLELIADTGHVHEVKLVYEDVVHTWETLYPNRVWRTLAKLIRPIIASRTINKSRLWHRLPFVTVVRHDQQPLLYGAYIKGPYVEKRCVGYRVWPIEQLQSISLCIIVKPIEDK